jgi:hypothetical protein
MGTRRTSRERAGTGGVEQQTAKATKKTKKVQKEKNQKNFLLSLFFSEITEMSPDLEMRKN